MRPTRDEIGLLVAISWSLRATCARRRVGCLLTDLDGRVLATGYNGPASGEAHCVESPCQGAALASGTGLELCEAIHAEQNALMYCSDPRKIHTCYVTSSPCISCVKLLLGTGCKRVVFWDRYAHDSPAEKLWTKTSVIWQNGETDKRSWERLRTPFLERAYQGLMEGFDGRHQG